MSHEHVRIIVLCVAMCIAIYFTVVITWTAIILFKTLRNERRLAKERANDTGTT